MGLLKNPIISIIIPTLNEERNLPRLFRSFKKLRLFRQAEVIIVDGGSTDRTVFLARKFGARVFQNPLRLRGAGCRIGVEKAQGELIAFTDADCKVPEEWLEGLVREIQNTQSFRRSDNQNTSTSEKSVQKIGAVGGSNRTPVDDSDFAKAVGEVLDLLTKPGSRYGYKGDKVTEIYHNSGCNVLYLKEAIVKAGSYDQKLITCEDEELDYRIRKAGYKLLYTPFVTVDHYRRTSYRSFFKQAYRYAIGRMQAGKKHPRMLKLFHFGPSGWLATLIGGLGELGISGRLGILGLAAIFGIFGIAAGAGYLALRYRHGSFFRYFILLLTWIVGWGIGFIRGLV